MNSKFSMSPICSVAALYDFTEHQVGDMLRDAADACGETLSTKVVEAAKSIVTTAVNGLLDIPLIRTEHGLTQTDHGVFYHGDVASLTSVVEDDEDLSEQERSTLVKTFADLQFEFGGILDLDETYWDASKPKTWTFKFDPAFLVAAVAYAATRASHDGVTPDAMAAKFAESESVA